MPPRTYRILSDDEYHRLQEFWPFNSGKSIPSPEQSRIAVAEDGSGKILGYWMCCVVAHIEPIWVGPGVRDGGFTATRMLKTLSDELHKEGIFSGYVFSDREEISGYLERLGFRDQNMKVYFGEV